MAWRVEASQDDVLETLGLALGPEFLDGVPRAELTDFVSRVRKHRYRKGEAIFHEDDVPGDIYIVSEGCVKHRLVSPTGDEFTHHLSPPGDFFGSFAGDRRAGGTLALTDCSLLVVDRKVFMNFLNVAGGVNAYLLQRSWSRSSELLKKIHDLAFLNVPMRLASILLDVAIDGEQKQTCVPEYLNQNELAQLVGTSRESVNQWLKFFAKEEWISINRRHITIQDPDALRRRANLG